MNSPIISIHSLTKQFQKIKAVDNIDLQVYKGDVFGFLGPNGAGKSTTIRMLLTLIKPTSGKIEIFNQNMFTNRSEILKRIGAIVEKPDFYLYLTAYENLKLLGKISGADVSQKSIMEMLEFVGLEKRFNSKVKTFSFGMKQRLGLAQALLHNPDLIILDEPTTGLDPLGIIEIRDLIISLSKDKGKTIFLSSHVLSEIQLIANRMAIINKGKIAIQGYVKDLLNTESLTIKIEVNNVETALNIINKNLNIQTINKTEDNTIFLKTSRNDIPNINKQLVENGLNVYSILQMNSLEDYFIKITLGDNNADVN